MVDADPWLQVQRTSDGRALSLKQDIYLSSSELSHTGADGRDYKMRRGPAQCYLLVEHSFAIVSTHSSCS